MVGRSLGDRNPNPNPSPNQAVLQGAFVGYLNRLKPLTLVRELTKAEIVRSNLAHAAVSRALSIRADLEAQLSPSARAGDRAPPGPAPVREIGRVDASPVDRIGTYCRADLRAQLRPSSYCFSARSFFLLPRSV